MKPHPDKKARQFQENHPSLYKAIMVISWIIALAGVAGLIYIVYYLLK